MAYLSRYTCDNRIARKEVIEMGDIQEFFDGLDRDALMEAVISAGKEKLDKLSDQEQSEFVSLVMTEQMIQGYLREYHAWVSKVSQDA
jgi:hypothetical protein